MCELSVLSADTDSDSPHDMVTSRLTYAHGVGTGREGVGQVKGAGREKWVVEEWVFPDTSQFQSSNSNQSNKEARGMTRFRWLDFFPLRCS